jgi:fatty acid desaturase
MLALGFALASGAKQINFEVAMVMSSIPQIKKEKAAIVRRHAQADDFKGLRQVLTTLTLLVIFWWFALLGVQVSYWLTGGATVVISLFTLRAFALMHECGHGSLFRSRHLNRTLTSDGKIATANNPRKWPNLFDYGAAPVRLRPARS